MTIQITYHTVISAAEDIGSAATTIKGQLQSLDGRVRKVVATWDGEAQAAFNGKHKGWDMNVTGLTETLQALSQQVHAAAGGYKRTDRKGAMLFDF